tara:strand:+ start:137 stop:310 length:174 start_codon:yes stop_codon:yes gene_type:complete
MKSIINTLNNEIHRLEIAIVDITKETDTAALEYYDRIDNINKIITILNKALRIYKKL